MTETHSEDQQLPAPSRRRSPEVEIGLLSAVLIAISIGLILALPGGDVPTRDAPWWVFPAIMAGFAATEFTIFRFQFRREAIAFSLSEIPLAFGLVFLAPWPSLAARIVGSMSVVLLLRRPPPHKFAFNVANFSFELALAYVVFRGLIDLWGDGDAQTVVAVIAATGVGGIVSSVLVSVAISRYEGDLLGRITSELKLAWWLFIVNSTLAGMVIGLALVSGPLVLLTVVPVALLWYVIKAFGAIDQRLRDLDAVHGFTGLVGQSLDPGEIGQAAVEEAAKLLRAEEAALVLFDVVHGGVSTTSADLGVRLPATLDDPRWVGHLSGGTFVLSGSELDVVTEPGSKLDEVLVSPVRDQTGPIGLLVVGGRSGAQRRFDGADIARLQNLTEQLAMSLRKGMLHQRIEHEARHDGLTELPNRGAFERAVALAAEQRASEGVLFVMMLDLDRFKEVNDTLGHHAGDDLLVEVARRLVLRLEPEDVLARLSGDEFAILGHRRTREEMIELAETCVSDVGRSVTLDGLEIVVTASAGLAVLAEDDVDASKPLRHADIAMYNAKSQRLGVEVYRDEIDRRTPARLSMLGDLRAAIEGRELDVHFQPKLDLSTGTIVGAEALVRWTHSVRGMVPPTQFVRVAEDTGLIKQLTDLMLDRGISELREIHDRGYHLGLAVNLSTHDLLDTKLAERVDGHLQASGVDPALLTLEITESSLLIDAPRARATINELNEVGVHMSIDDFGTGYSSLSYLRRLPVSELKIDRSFVANVLLDEQDEVIVRSTIDLGHNLGLEVVAEGVENNEVLERLQSFGCDVAQGFCISRPLPANHLMSWLATTVHTARRHDPLDIARLGGHAGTPRGELAAPAAASDDVEPLTD